MKRLALEEAWPPSEREQLKISVALTREHLDR